MKIAVPQDARSVVVLVSLNISIAASLLLLHDNLPPEIPLFYGAPEGQEQLAPSAYLVIPPILAGIVSLLNYILSRVLKDDFLKQVFLGVSIIVTTLSSITVIRILMLVGNL